MGDRDGEVNRGSWVGGGEKGGGVFGFLRLEKQFRRGSEEVPPPSTHPHHVTEHGK